MRAPDLHVTSLQNERVKALVRLRDRRERDEQGVTVVEEPLVVARALAAGVPLVAVYYCPEYLDPEAEELLAELRAAAPECVRLAPPVMDKIAYRDRSEGLLLVARQVRTALADLDLSGSGSVAPLLVVLEGVEKPGNLGAVLRVADAAGADAVIVCGGGTDPFNPNVLRASRGACFHVPVVCADGDELTGFLADRGIATVATSPAADHAWDQLDLRGPVAVVLGTEHEGLSGRWLAAADHTAGIPMLGVGDSLNVSTTAAVLLFEAVRQRQPR